MDKKTLISEKITCNEQQTIAWGRHVGREACKGDVYLLQGDLGAGKTHFVKGFASALGVKQGVCSPTFTILNIYQGEKMPIYHFDMYRLGSALEAEELGFAEQFDSKTLDGVCVVEWPDNVLGLINPPYFEIEITALSQQERKIKIFKVER